MVAGILEGEARNKAVASARVAVIVGGLLDPDYRDAVRKGARPRVDVLELETRLDSDIYDFTYYQQKGGSLFDRALRWLAGRVRNHSLFLAARLFSLADQYDVIFATGEDVGIPLGVMLRLFRKRSPALVMRLENPAYGKTPFRRWLYARIFQSGVRRIQTVLCRTQAHMGYLRDALHVPADRLRFQSEPVDLSFYNCAMPMVEEARRVVPASPYILSAGLEMRDYDTLIEAARNLPVQVVIAAGSPWAHSRFQPGTRGGLPTNVTVSAYTPVQMRELYRGALLVVVPVKPTLRACGMNVILEAWAMQRPVIALRTEGLASYILDGGNGMFVPPGDPQALRAAVQRLAGSPDLSCCLAEGGRRFAVEFARLEHYIAAVESAVLSARQV